MAASLIVRWDEYHINDNWRDFTDYGLFTNHDPENERTLYGAEVMVSPHCRRHGVGSKLYSARRGPVKKWGLMHIRAAARLRGYHAYAEIMDAEEYVVRVIRCSIYDPTLSFQLHRGFEVMAMISGYLRMDPESRGFAAVIEWINAAVAAPSDWSHRDTRYARLSAEVPSEHGSDSGSAPSSRHRPAILKAEPLFCRRDLFSLRRLRYFCPDPLQNPIISGNRSRFVGIIRGISGPRVREVDYFAVTARGPAPEACCASRSKLKARLLSDTFGADAGQFIAKDLSVLRNVR